MCLLAVLGSQGIVVNEQKVKSDSKNNSIQKWLIH